MSIQKFSDFTSNNRSIYPHPQEIEWGKGSFKVISDTKIVVESECDMDSAQLMQQQLQERFGVFIPVEKKSFCADKGNILIARDNLASGKAEGYRISVSEDSLQLAGVDKRGVLYGTQTLLQIAVKKPEGDLVFPAVDILDWPNKPVRGVHIYMPARESLEGFKRILMMLSHIKMNTIIIEVGGGMEYEKHPEINIAWEKLCRDAEAYPGGPRGIQRSEAYWKDSIHTELGGGSYLTKSEVKDIVDFAKRLGFNVVPEIQGLSHAYYMTMAHPEIAERPQEPFPDTYCPSNLESYKLYYDIADEVVEVFQPEWVSIGHDEVRILAECPLCKDITGEDLLAHDINTLYNYYKSKGIGVMMWGEKLQNLLAYDGKHHGGVFEEKTDKLGRYWRVPETYKAVDMVPKDIFMLDWYHSLSQDTEIGFKEKGFTEIFGNFSGSMIADWDVRSLRSNVLGAEVSTWCLCDEYTIARNNLIYEIAFSAGVLWWKGYSDSLWEEEHWEVVKAMPVLKEMLKKMTFPLTGSGRDEYKLFHPAKRCYNSGVCMHVNAEGSVNQTVALMLSGLKQAEKRLCGVPIEMSGFEIYVGNCVKSLVFMHAATKPMKFIHSIEFVDMSDYILGKYVVQYEDGTEEFIDLHYGIHIGRLDMDWNRYRSGEDDLPDSVDEFADNRKQTKKTLPPYYKPAEAWNGSLAYFTVPVILDTPEGEKTVYAYEWLNPKPNVKIRSIKALSTNKDSSQKLLLFGVAGSI